MLVEKFMQVLNSKTRKSIRAVQREAMNVLMDYHWPGNVRELKSILHYAFTIAENGTIKCNHLPPQLQGRALSAGEIQSTLNVKDAKEKHDLIEALNEAGGNQVRAAKLLGVNRVTVWNRMRKYGINLKREIRR